MPYLDAVAAAAEEAERTWPDLFVERKGEIAFTIHWRTAPGPAPHEGALADLAARHGLDTQPGRMACELRPPVPVDKGAAVERLWDDHGWLPLNAFAGDDRGDLSAFDLFDALSRSGRGGDGRRGVRPHRRTVERRRRPSCSSGPTSWSSGPAGLADLLGRARQRAAGLGLPEQVVEPVARRAGAGERPEPGRRAPPARPRASTGRGATRRRVWSRSYGCIAQHRVVELVVRARLG